MTSVYFKDQNLIYSAVIAKKRKVTPSFNFNFNGDSLVKFQLYTTNTTFDLFVPNAPFLYPLKISENLTVF